jgi:two-component system phosphate regulon response regulator PhoB
MSVAELQNKNPRSGTALVVDSRRVNRFLIERTLTEVGFSVTSAATGLAGLASAAELPPDVAVIQSSLPLMRGAEVCRQLLADSRTKHVHVIMVTPEGDAPEVQRALDAGAKDCLSHPFDVPELRACAIDARASQRLC